MRRALVALTFLLTISLCGCSGGSRSQPFYPLSSTTRLLQDGDSWTYVSSLVSYDEIGKPYYERFVTTVSRQTLDGTKASLDMVTKNTHGPFLSEFHQSIYQPSSADIALVARTQNGGFRLTFHPEGDGVIVLPGNWSVGKKIAYELSVVDIPALPPFPVQAAADYTVTGTEVVSTPLGRFDTWVVKGIAWDSNFFGQSFFAYPESEVTYWYAPQLGAYVKMQLEGPSSDNPDKTYKRTLLLQSTSVPLSQSSD